MADYTIGNLPILRHRTRDSLLAQRNNMDFVRTYLDLLSFDMVRWDDDFLGDTLHSGYQLAGEGTSLAMSAPTSATRNGIATMVTGGTDNYAEIASLGLEWYSEQNCTFFALVKMSAITTIKVEVGFCDQTAATGGAASNNTGAIVQVLATPDSTATDGACWVFDTDDTTSWQLFTVKNDATPQKTEPSYIGNFNGDAAPVADRWELLGVSLAGTNARFYRGSMVGSDSSEGDFTKRLTMTYDSGWIADAITKTAALTPHIFVQNRTGSTRTLSVDALWAWQYRQKFEGVYQAA
jgi:hypothetical protein